MHREASMGTAQRGQQPRKPDLLTLSIPFHGNLGLSGNLLPCDVLTLACLLSSACTHPWGHGLLPRFSVGSHLAVPADGNPRTSWHLLPQVHCRVCNSGGLSRAPRISFALIILMFTMQRPWCYCPCFTPGGGGGSRGGEWRAEPGGRGAAAGRGSRGSPQGAPGQKNN